jgi:hypothetical protein
MKAKRLLTVLQEAATVPCPEPDEPFKDKD